MDFPKAHLRLWSGIIAVVTLSVYALSLGNGFVSLDDGMLITGNPLVKHISAYNILRIFTSYDPELYIPLTLLTYQIEYAFVGGSAMLFHTTNLLLHICNALLVLLAVQQLSKKPWLAIFCGFVFALHPLHVDVVAWASARKDVLSALFGLLSLNCYLRYSASPKTENRKWLTASITTFAVGLLSKVVIVLLPVFYVVLDDFGKRKITKDTLKEKIPFGILSILFLAIAIIGRTKNALLLTPLETLMMACKSIVFSIKSIALPTGLSAIYPQHDSIEVIDPSFFIPIVLVVVGIGLFFWSYNKAKYVFLAGSFYGLLLAPNIVNFTKGGFIFFADNRYSYLPSIAVILLVGLGLHALCTTEKKMHGMAAAVLFLLLCFATNSHIYARTWQDSEALYRNVVRQFPESALSLNNLGAALNAKGKPDEALELFERSAAIDPDFRALSNIGLIYQQRGEIDMAITYYEKAITSIDTIKQPQAGMYAPYYFLAGLKEVMDEDEEAVALYEEAAERGSQYAEPHLNLGIGYQKRLRIEEAEQEFLLALEADPYLIPAHYHVSAVQAEQGKLTEARNHLQSVVWMAPDYEQASKHLGNIERLID
ncbi:MAG: DUF3808 domain-containing protein [bacterium]|nr:DUF3808 domain-containing protein [bacterium]